MNHALQKVVGRNVGRQRHVLGLSQEEMAARLGVHRTYLGSLERGEQNLTLLSLERLADKLAVAPHALLEAKCP